MARTKWWLLGIAALLVLWLAVAWLTNVAYTYNYKIVVSVRDHGQLKTASSVVLVKERRFTLTNGSALPRSCGEATPVSLSNGKYIFALLNGKFNENARGQFQWLSAPTDVLLKRLGLETQWAWKSDDGLLSLPDRRDVITLAPYEMPEFVSFKDRSDARTGMHLDPEYFSRAGEGVTLESVTLQPTDEPVTTGRIRRILPFIKPFQDKLAGLEDGYYHTRQFKAWCL